MNSKWISTVASIWIQCSSGSLYTFSIYSQTLKSTQHYDQSTLDIVSVSKDIGANISVLSGLLYDYLATRTSNGPWIVHLLGSAQCFLGYFLMWAAVSGLLQLVPLPLMCLFMLVVAHGQSFFNTSNVVTGVHNFPNYSGTIVGILKGFLGLSGAILIQVYRTIFNNNPVSYLLMLSLLPPINTLILMWFVRIHNTHHEGESEKKYLNIFSLMSLVIAAYLMIVIILENVLSLQLSIRIFTFVVLMVLLASLLFVAFSANESRAFNNASESFLVEGSNNPLLADDDTNNRRRVQQGENLNLFEAAKTVNFWILFVCMACGMGSGLATVNNISQIGESLGYSTVETGSLVALWSIWNFLGRFGAGYMSDYFLHAKGCARPFFMMITLMIMSIGHVVIAYGLPGALYVGSILIGICYGSQWSLMPTIVSEIFGVRHMGSIYNTITIASSVGSYIFSVRVIGYMYDKEASEEGNICVGTHCFMFPFLIMASATIFGSLIALCLFLRSRSFYGLVVLRRIQNNV